MDTGTIFLSKLVNTGMQKEKAHKTKKPPTDPIRDKKEIEQSTDEKIDQDFPGFPHHPSKEKDIKTRKSPERDGEKEI